MEIHCIKNKSAGQAAAEPVVPKAKAKAEGAPKSKAKENADKELKRPAAAVGKGMKRPAAAIEAPAAETTEKTEEALPVDAGSSLLIFHVWRLTRPRFASTSHCWLHVL